MKKLSFISPFLLVLLFANIGFAQYLDSPRSGYLPASSGGVAVDSPLFHDPGPVVTLGGALDLGMSFIDTETVDQNFFEEADAHELNGATSLDVNFQIWLQFHQHLRLGMDSSFGEGGDGIGSAKLSGGGLLIQGGGALGNSGWSLWGGAVLGKGNLTLRTEDAPGNWYEYEGRYNRVELLGSAEAEIAPLIALRGSVSVAHGWLVHDVVRAGVPRDSDFVPRLPSDTRMDLNSATIMIGIVFGY